MTLKVFLKEVNSLNSLIEKSSSVFDYLETISSFKIIFFEMSIKFRNSLDRTNSSKTHNNVNELVNLSIKHEKECLDQIREIRPREFITILNDLKRSLKHILIFDDKFKEDLSDEIDILIDLHTDAYSERNFEQIFAFSNLCFHFLERFGKIKFSAKIFKENLILDYPTISSNNSIIDIQILSEIEDLEKFYSFLKLLDKLYKDLCKTIDIQYNDYPLNIIKIESGSIWSKVFGNSKVIELIKDLLFGLANYIRDLQTGKIKRKQFENEIEKANLLLDLTKKAKESGMVEKNIKLLEKTFNQALIGVSKSLPESTTEIIINDKTLLNLSKKETKLISEKKVLLLKNSIDKTERNLD